MVQQFDKPVRQWETNISILKNPLLWFQVMMVALLSSSYILLLLLGFNLFESQWEDIPASFIVASFVAAGFFLAFSVVLFLMYWRGIPTRYILEENSIEQYTLKRSKKTAGVLSVFGMLSGNKSAYTLAGTTLLAQSREKIAVEWKEVTHLLVFPKRNEIQLRNEWRTIMQVVCPPEQFDGIQQFIQQKTENNRLPEMVKENTSTPFEKKVVLSIFSLIFGVFLFPRLPIHYVGIFAIATMLFGLLVLWSSGVKQRIFAGILFILPIIGVVLAFVWGEVDMSKQGAVYALLIELLMLGYFMLLALMVTFKYVR
jgi:hypothetical protein